MARTSPAEDGLPRDYVGYGRNRPDPKWPDNARIAVNINVAYEGGGERNVLDGDECSEGVLTDTGLPSAAGTRNPLVESSFEYGSRVGIWRLMRIFEQFDVTASMIAVATALERNAEVCSAFVELGHEIVNHGHRWIDYVDVDEATEREHIRLSTESIERTTGVRPQG
ncbi:MAG: polysaccharide deacetylase family protein, partial [Gaiellaceae bacterium]